MDEDQESPWCDEEACCESCDHVWIAVHPCCEELECPKCGKMTRSTHSINNEAWLESWFRDWKELRGEA